MARHPLTTKKNNVKESIYETQPGKSRSDLLDIIPSGGLLEVLKNDKRCIVQAASYAQKAVDFLHSLQLEAKAEAT